MSHQTAEAQTTDSSIGRVIAGKYQLVRLLGQGGMGAVYEGRNTSTLKRCAVKLLLSPELGGNAELVKRFFREARASSIIESDHIVQVYDSGYDSEVGWPYMVMEMLGGEDLEKTIGRMGALQPIAAAKLILQAAMGLAKAHEAGIVHRDIKPANLYLTSRETGDLLVKVLDFGIAKVKMESLQETSNGLTRTGSMLGTPLYMSPDQVNGASNIDARSDVWSLGIVLFELLSGSIPWSNASSLGRLMAAILTEDLPLLQDRAPWVPPELAEIVHRAISRDPSKRFANCSEFRDALLAIVPDGPRITPDLIQSVPSEYRDYTAPRLALSDDGMLRATTRTGLATQPGTSKKGGAGAVLVVVALLAAVGGGGLFAYRSLAPQAEPEPLVTTKVEAPTVTAPTPPPPQVAPVLQRFELVVGPPGVTITVDGTPTTVTDGKIEIVGSMGDTRKVALTFKGKSEEHVVGITQAGAVPGKIEFAKKVEQKPLAGGGRARPARAGAAGPAQPAPAAEAKSPPKKESGLVRDTGEF